MSSVLPHSAKSGQGRAQPPRGPWLLAALVLLLATACRATSQATEAPRATARISFDGLDVLSRGELLDAIELDLQNMDRYGFDQAAVDDAAFGLRQHYFSRGYPFARVEYRFRPEGEASAVFLVQEGPRIRIGRVRLEGVDELPFDQIEGATSPRELERFFKPVRRTIFGRRKPEWFVQASIESGRRELADFLRGAGYLDVLVSEAATTFLEDQRLANVDLEVHCGPRYDLGSVEFRFAPLSASSAAATPIPEQGDIDPERLQAGEGAVEAALAELSELAAGALGRPYAPQYAWGLRARAIEVFRASGHPDCLASFQERRENGEVKVVYSIDPGPLIHIGKVELEGFVDTRLPFAKSRVGIEPGSLYDSRKVRKAFRSLYRTGIFESVDIDLAEGEGQRDLRVGVVESPGRELYVEPGWGSYERARVLVGGRERNLFGTGKVLSAEAKLGDLAQGGKVYMTDPWFLDKDLIATYGLFVNRREEPSFTRREAGLSTAVTEEWNEDFTTTLGYQYRRTLVGDVTVDDEAAQAALDNVDISSIALTLTWDDRDDVFVPTEGLRARTIIEWGGEQIGSQLDFTRLKLDVAQLYPLGEDTVLGLGLGVGIIWPLNETDVIPLQERFFNGGEDTVRSYREDELGPLDGDRDPIGGEAYTVASIELRRRLAGNLQGAFFIDTGHVAEKANDVFDGEGYGWGIGLGLRYLLPVGPIRLDGAFNPDAGAGQDDFVLHFAVGMAF